MPKHMFRILLSVLIMTLGFGCSSSGVKVRAYKQDKQRIDQQVEGASGNWENAPEAVVKANKDTRKIYVLEVTHGTDTVEKTQMMEEEETAQQSVVNSSDKKITETKKSVSQVPDISIPAFDDIVIDADDIDSNTGDIENQNSEFIDYKVEKDDTLQKISKKFYGSFSKWPRIYEANRAKIKNPDSIKPGITIRIPKE